MYILGLIAVYSVLSRNIKLKSTRKSPNFMYATSFESRRLTFTLLHLMSTTLATLGCKQVNINPIEHLSTFLHHEISSRTVELTVI